MQTRTLRRLCRTVLAPTVAAAISFSSWASEPVKVLFKTTAGDFTVALNAEKAPETVKNFLQYVNDKHYDGTIFHRVIGNFMVQGGGFTPAMQEKPTRAPIKLEAQNGLKNVRGSIAMARTAAPHSATAQFYINVVDNPGLDAPSPDGYGYTVFGTVVQGMDTTVEKIRKAPTGNKNGYSDVPMSALVIQSATVIK